MKKLALIFSTVACLTALGCQEKPIGGQVENTYWKLAAVKSGNKKTSAVKGKDISAIFSTNKISGISTCNRYSADFTANGSALAVNGLTSTEKMCDDINLEQTYLELLSKSIGYSVQQTGLTIFSENGQLKFVPMSAEEARDFQYTEGIGRLSGLFPAMEAGKTTHFFPIVRVDRPAGYPFTGKLVAPELYPYFDSETSEIWTSTGGDVLAVGQLGDFYVCRVPGRYVSSDIALFRLENGMMQRSETIAWAWCDEGWCNQQDAWLQDANQDGRLDIIQHYILTDDQGKIREERLSLLVQDEEGNFKAEPTHSLNKADYKMAPI